MVSNQANSIVVTLKISLGQKLVLIQEMISCSGQLFPIVYFECYYPIKDRHFQFKSSVISAEPCH